jgi:hypothetical protein
VYHAHKLTAYILDIMTSKKTVLFFQRPPPLSPNTTAVYNEEEKRWYRKYAGKMVLVNAVPQADCIYYWWFEYLKRSEKYKTVCEKNGRSGSKALRALYVDFGNIHKYEFWNWWKERGQFLFGERAIKKLGSFLDLKDVESIKDEISSGLYKLIAIPTNLNKTTIKRQFSRLLKEMEVTDEEESLAKYPLRKTKVDAESLKNCLYAYDLKQEGKTNVEIGGYFIFAQSKIDELIEDGRAQHSYVKSEKMMKLYQDNQKAEKEALEKAVINVDKKLEAKGKQDPSIAAVDYDELVDKEMGILIRDKNILRTKTKNYLNVSANRMIKKAKANIAAVEKGQFPMPN